MAASFSYCSCCCRRTVDSAAYSGRDKVPIDSQGKIVDEKKEPEVVKAEVVAEKEATSLSIHGDDDDETDLLRFRMQMTTKIVSFVLFSAGTWQIYMIVAAVKGIHYVEPAWLPDVVKMTVAAGLILLGITSTQAINVLFDRKLRK